MKMGKTDVAVDQSIDPVLILLGDEIKLGIIFALKMFGSMNLKSIAKIVNKPESTTLRHIKSMMPYKADNQDGFEIKLLEIDMEATEQKWGKYYRLTTIAENILVYQTQHIVDKSVERIDKNEVKANNLESIAKMMKSVSTISYNLANAATQYMIERVDDNKELKQQLSKTFAVSLSLLQIENEEDREKLNKAITEFQEKIKKIKQNTEKTMEGNHAVYLLSMPLSIIDPNKSIS